jgi:membrane protein
VGAVPTLRCLRQTAVPSGHRAEGGAPDSQSLDSNRWHLMIKLMPLQTPARQEFFGHPLRFLLRVLKGFQANQGLLLSGAIAYYTLLSIVPLFILLLVGLSHVVDAAQALKILTRYLELLVPGESSPLLEQVKVFLEHRQALSWVLVGFLLFFSSMAFAVLESAMAVIFSHRGRVRRRHFLISVLLPYLFILLLATGFLVVTLIVGVLQAVENLHLPLLGWELPLDGLVGTVLYWLGLGSQILMLTAIYLLMPVGKLPLHHALIGGITAALLWELTRHLLIWYFAHLSFVNVVYGSLATTIIALLTLEIAAIILLLGAQVIAEYERIGAEREDKPFPVI